MANRSQRMINPLTPSPLDGFLDALLVAPMLPRIRTGYVRKVPTPAMEETSTAVLAKVRIALGLNAGEDVVKAARDLAHQLEVQKELVQKYESELRRLATQRTNLMRAAAAWLSRALAPGRPASTIADELASAVQDVIRG